MDFTTEDLKNMQDLLELRRSMPLFFFHSVSEIETDFGYLTPTLVDVNPGTIVIN